MGRQLILTHTTSLCLSLSLQGSAWWKRRADAAHRSQCSCPIRASAMDCFRLEFIHGRSPIFISIYIYTHSLPSPTQINSKNWCRKGRRGGICNIKCEGSKELNYLSSIYRLYYDFISFLCTEFLNDEISDDSRCAMQIFNRHGFQAWPGWMSKCRGRTLPDVSRC